MNFAERLTQSPPVLLDGAMGTELTRRGVETFLPLWSAGALETHPEVVRQIHLDYLQAGAEIITTNTFRTQARTLRNSAKARELTLEAVQLAREAVQLAEPQQPVWVAGSVAPLEDCYSPQLTPHEGYCLREHGEMIQNLVAGGVDMLLIETMNTIHEAAAAASHAHLTGLPFLVSFVLDEDFNLLSGESLARAIEVISPSEPAAFLLNCIPTRHLNGALAKLRPLTDKPIGAYGNMGTPDDVQGWASAHDISPKDYCQHVAEWVKQGAQIVGSCCGSTPEHTAALRKWLSSH